MAEYRFHDAPGLSGYLVVTFEAAAQFYNATGTAMEAYNASNWTTAKYLHAVTEGKSGDYVLTIPALLPGTAAAPVVYNVTVWYCPGGTGAVSAANDAVWLEDS